LVAAAFVGGVAGSLARGLVELATNEIHGPPWVGRIVVNLLGAILIGALVARIAVRNERGAPVGIEPGSRLAEHLWGAGFLGGFTTVSGFAWDMAAAVASGAMGQAAVILVANGIVGIAGCALGFWLVRRVRPA
jgi:CrcB protein